MPRPHEALLELAAGRPLPPLHDLDTAALVDSALEHRMQGLLWTRVEQREVELPRTQLHALAREQLRIRAHHGRLWQVLTHVTQELRLMGIEVVTAKGVTAEQRWYQRTGERPCNDIDLWLAPQDHARVEEIAAALTPHHPLRGDLRALVASGLLQSVDLAVDGVEVDLHADLFKFEIPTRQVETLWDRTAIILAPDGTPLRALDAEMSLVHFLVHLNKDRFSRLLGFVDVARVIEREDLDWAAIERFARGEGLLVPLASALQAVAEVLQLPPPGLTAEGMRARLWQALWPEASRLRGEVGMIHHVHRQFWLPFIARGRTLEALRWWVRRRLLPPSALVPLYYPDTSGPYAWRLLTGRIATAWRRLQAQRASEAPAAETAIEARYKTFPPKWAHIRVPRTSRSAALAGLALYSPCQPKGYLLRDAAWLSVRIFGPRGLPGRSRPLPTLTSPAEWRELREAWRETLGAYDALAVYARPQEGRTGFAVLLMGGGRPIAFIRVRPGDLGSLRREDEALHHLEQRTVAFWHARVMATAAVSGWSYLAMTALEPQRHRALPVERVSDVIRELEHALAGVPRPTGVPEHWTPMHGDFTPWNCRLLRDGGSAVVDWEDVGWGPPGADDVLFRATAASLTGASPGPGEAEAVDYWRQRLDKRLRDRPRDTVTMQTLAALARMR